MGKRVDGSEFDVAKRTTAATKLLDGDAVICAGLAEDEDTFVMQSEKNYFLRVTVGDIPEKKKGAVGVRGMRLNKGDFLAGAWILKQDANPVVEVRDREIALNRLHIGNRDTKGVKR
ncbi:MAG: DNA topoisomerase, partial [Clostridiales bacterium]|nr:DNA topoisomerase [Clostridiales bacterium]